VAATVDVEAPIFLGTQYGTYFISPVWRPEFLVGSCKFGKLVYSGVIVFQIYFLLHGKYNPRPLERPVG
jgi:hypothetical protein